MLFSKMKVAELLDPITDSKKASLERHHLFPKNYLARIKTEDDRERNQIANFALVEWIDNIEISDTAPVEYLPDHLTRFSGEEIAPMYRWQVLPDGWENLNYHEFLEQRRKMMANIIKDGFETIG